MEWPRALTNRATEASCQALTTRSHIIVLYTAITIKVVHAQSGKVEYERERTLGIAKKMNLLAIPSILSPSYSTFPLYFN
jgi:hypothetical protein